MMKTKTPLFIVIETTTQGEIIRHEPCNLDWAVYLASAILSEGGQAAIQES